MTKADLVEEVVRVSDLSKKQAEAIVNTVFLAVSIVDDTSKSTPSLRPVVQASRITVKFAAFPISVSPP